MKGVSMHRSGIWILACILMGCSVNAFAAEAVLDDAEVISDDEGLNMSAGMDGEEDVLYNVSFPADIHAYLDPGNLSGRGQIFSDRYVVENYGNTDVTIKITNIDLYCLSTEDVYEFSEEEVTDPHSRVKKFNIDMVWGNETRQTEKVLQISEGIRDECVLSLESAEYNEGGERVSSGGGSCGYFYFTGTMNSNPNIVWDEGEIIAHFDYEIVCMEKEEKGLKDESPEMQETPVNSENEDYQEEKENPEEAEDSKKEEDVTDDTSEDLENPEEDSKTDDTFEETDNQEEDSADENFREENKNELSDDADISENPNDTKL